MKILRWLAKNIGTLLTAFVLAVIVWVSAVIASDPNEEHILARSVPIEIIGQDSRLANYGGCAPGMSPLFFGHPPRFGRTLNNDQQSVRAWVDLIDLGAGVHEVPGSS